LHFALVSGFDRRSTPQSLRIEAISAALSLVKHVEKPGSTGSPIMLDSALIAFGLALAQCRRCAWWKMSGMQ